MDQLEDEVFYKLYKIIRTMLTINPEFYFLEKDKKGLENIYENAKKEYEQALKDLKILFTPAFNENDLNQLENYIISLFMSEKGEAKNYGEKFTSMQRYWWSSEITKNYSNKSIEIAKVKDLEIMISVASIIETTLLKYANNKFDTALNAVYKLKRSNVIPMALALQKVLNDDNNTNGFVSKYEEEEIELIISEMKVEVIINEENAFIKLLRYLDTKNEIPKILFNESYFGSDSKVEHYNNVFTKKHTN